jgi:uncharacterized protein YjbI with pentapeptide repeats
MRKWLLLCVALPGIVNVLLLVRPLAVWADCVIETASETREALVKHLSNGCTEDERRAHAVQADEVLRAIGQGRAVDLDGVVMVGDVLLDQLPLTPVPTSDQNPPIRELLASRRVKDVRVVSQPIAIRDSRIEGTIATRLKEGYVLMRGPLTMTGTTFEGMLDLSHMLFNEPVNLSDAVFRREAYFIHAVFTQPARFERTAFGVHTRFHRARFADKVTFERAGFNGLAEFLEVTFEKESSFVRSHFTMGTGFSGARFNGVADFSDTVFGREAFFLFTHFDGDAHFRGTTFRGQADFSDAEFHGSDNFSSVSFAADPLFQRAKLSGSPPARGALQRSQYFYGMAASFLVFTVLLVWVLRKRSLNDHHI